MAEASRGSGGNLRRIAMLVAIATALSKLAGLFRQQAIAAAFGVGAAYDAFNYAYVLPGFLLILLGGINGPFHSAMVSVMAKRERQDSAQLLAAINTLVGLGLLVVTLLLVLLALQSCSTKKRILGGRFEAGHGRLQCGHEGFLIIVSRLEVAVFWKCGSLASAAGRRHTGAPSVPSRAAPCGPQHWQREDACDHKSPR